MTEEDANRLTALAWDYRDLRVQLHDLLNELLALEKRLFEIQQRLV